MTTVKLIRDNYQHIIPQEKWYIAPLSKLPELLANKLIEECQEMLAAQSKQQQIAEAGDVLEVLTALQNYTRNNHSQTSWQNRCPTTTTDLLKTAKKFANKLLLINLLLKLGSSLTANCKIIAIPINCLGKTLVSKKSSSDSAMVDSNKELCCVVNKMVTIFFTSDIMNLYE